MRSNHLDLSESSNYGWKSLLDVLMQNIAGGCHQTFENRKFVDITQQFFALLPQVNFPANNLNFQIQAIFLNLF